MSTILSGPQLDEAAELWRIVATDPDAVTARLAELQSAEKSHNAALARANDATSKAGEMLKKAQIAIEQENAAKDAGEALTAELDAKQADLEDREKKLLQAMKDFEAKQKADAAAIAEQTAKLATQGSAYDLQLKNAMAAVDRRAEELAKREKAQGLAEAALAAEKKDFDSGRAALKAALAAVG